MKMLLRLIRTELRVAFGISVIKYRFTKERKKLWEPILTLLGALIGIGSMMILFSIFAISSFYIFKKSGQPVETLLAVSFLASQFFLLFFGIFHILSAFYFSKDMDFLISLPVKPYQVMGSKFVTIIVNEYIMSIPMVLPSVVVYGIGMGEGIMYWLKALISILLVPVIPLAISFLIVIVLMRFVNIKKSKDLIVVVASFLSMAIGIGVNFYVQKMMNGGMEDYYDMGQIQDWVIKNVGSKFPPSIWVTYGLSKPGMEGWGYFLLFVLISVLLFTFLLWVGNRVFYKGILSGNERSGKKRLASFETASDKYIKVSSPLTALFWKEWKLLLRTPVFMINGLSGMIIMPVMTLISILGQSQESIGNFIKVAREPRNDIYVSLVGFGLMVLAASLNMVSSTAVSREGYTFWISKMIPVSPRKQIISKLLHGMAISTMGILVIGAFVVGLIGVSVLKLLVLIFLSSLASMTIAILDLIIDIFRPKLDWTNPHEAVKTNLNGLFGIIVSMGYMFFMTVFASAMVLFRMPQTVIFLGIFIFEVVVLLPCIIVLFKVAENRYKNIEI
ncbi:MAG TPA: hypothetical protein PK033_12555 [Acetivibrio sp.]|nr:hypothetical protein [Acetivibrio sp.]HPT89963.1 hypothetical protein [Acetivibrio sp.]HQA58691.1 hypothetical protein [Acetivibrio sp.]